MEEIQIRKYTLEDYPTLKKLYEQFGWFDMETDSEERISKQITNDSGAILLAVRNNEVIGTVTLLPTIRLGLFFRLVTDDSICRSKLLKEGERIFKEKGYTEVHIIAPEENITLQTEYEDFGFQKGKLYRWMWKKI